jgi:hypothetical protein
MSWKICPVLGIALLAASAAPLGAQSVDPDAVMQQLVRQQMEDMQRERAEQQRERSYDREMCLRVGYRGPDVDQCVRDSAAYRRHDFSVSGTPAAPARRPAIECLTFGDGEGGGITDCN